MKTNHETKKTVKTASKPSWMASLFNPEMDVVDMILEDHKPLKDLIKTLKDDSKDINERKRAYEEFAILLVSHAKPEEETVYVAMKKQKEMRTEGFEGDVEHGIADQLVHEIKRTSDQDLWSARVKVLAELVEHHIQEEESDMLPDFKKHMGKNQRIEIGRKFLELKTKLLEQGGIDNSKETTRTH